MKWSELTPNKKNELIAEKVFGWQPVESSGKKAWKTGTFMRASVPNFLTDPRAMRDIVIAMETAGYALRVRPGKKPGETEALVVSETMRFSAAYSSSKAFDAVCLAALNALGADID